MYKVNYSPLCNRIYITIKDHIQDFEAEAYKNDVFRAIDMTRPSFTVCLNMLEADSEALGNSDKFQEIRDYVKARAMLKSIHIINEEMYILHQKKPFSGVSNACTSLECAERFLNDI